MMNHLIIGFGYSGFYIAATLAQQNQRVDAFCRHEKTVPAFVNLHLLDVYQHDLPAQNEPFWLYYCLAPANDGLSDAQLEHFLARNAWHNCQGVTYLSSTAVYGNHYGNWVDEFSHCLPIYDRQQRRLHAESCWQEFAVQQGIPCAILRVAGIYGPGRLPIESARLRKPIIRPEMAPWSNLIFVNDLAKIAVLSAQNAWHGIFNVADGQPVPAGTLQKLVAEELGFQPAPELNYDTVLEQASPMSRFFLSVSKRINIDKLKHHLPSAYNMTSLVDGLKLSL